jgi:hypothetical protein
MSASQWKKQPPDRNRGEQLKTQAFTRLVEVFQKDGFSKPINDFLYRDRLIAA